MTIYDVTMTQPYIPSAKKQKDVFGDFMKAKGELEEEHKLTPDSIAVEKDWREMDSEEWDKVLEHFDSFMDDCREQLEKMREIQEEAAEQAAAKAPAYRKVLAASSAALKAASGIYNGSGSGEDATELEKLSWTYEMETDDQTILAHAKAANEMAADALSKYQELALSGDTETGIAGSDIVKESASVDEDENRKKTWTITTYTPEGIISQKTCDGAVIGQWNITFGKASDYKKVMDFISGFDSKDNLRFAGDKNFWEDFLAGRTGIENLVKVNDVWKTEYSM